MNTVLNANVSTPVVDKNVEIGARIRAKRKELKINQKAVATRLEISQPEVSNIEKGKRNVSASRATRLSELLKCSPEWILTGQN